MLRDKFLRTWHCFRLQAVLVGSYVICAPICRASEVCEPRALAQDWMCDEKLCKTQPATMRAVRKKVCSTTCRRAKDTEGARTDKLGHKTIN